MTAEELQYRHKRSKAIREYQQRIANGTAAWHDYWQLGVLLSRRAESYFWGPSNRKWRKVNPLLREAIADFNIAANVCGGEVVDLTGVMCDRAVAIARLSRYRQSIKPAPALGRLKIQIIALENLKDTEVSPAAIHQLAIAYHWYGYLLAGRVLQFPWSDEHEQCDIAFALAFAVFREELAAGTCPDNGAAYRSALLYYAVIQRRRSPLGWLKAAKACWQALKSAHANGDTGQMLRAIALLALGSFGENLVQYLLDH